MIDKTCFSWIQLVKKSSLPANAKYLCFYLSSFMNLEHELAWPSQKRIAYETGISEPTIRKWLKFLNEKEWLIIHHASRPVQTSGGIQMQNEYLINIPDEIIRGVADLPTIAKGGLAVDVRGVNESSKGGKQLTPNNNKNNNRSNKGRFTPPTLEEVKNYIQEKQYPIDPVKFFNHYETSDWYRGKNKIKNWKACTRTWLNGNSDKPAVYGDDGI